METAMTLQQRGRIRVTDFAYHFIKRCVIKTLSAAIIFLSIPANAQQTFNVRGWNILSNSYEDNLITLSAANKYKINHLQLSHDLVMDLNEMRDTVRSKIVNEMVRKAHDLGINEVILWDHALYDLKYYPEKFKTGPDGTINLDNKEFWDWFKSDYRSMMNLVPEADGIVLTFIETGARAENQFSRNLLSAPLKLAAVVDAVADVVCNELGKILYIRTFAYTAEEYKNIIGCIELIKNEKVRLMMKETPHDFFLTHPDDKFAGSINRPTLIEFDTGNEFNGQGIIANTWPEYVIRRCRGLMNRPNVIGYVARTDRYRDTRIVGTPNEILLLALKRYTEDQSVTPDIILDEFIGEKYGKDVIRFIKPAFKASYDIISSSLYTLGTNIANHSKMDFDPYKSSYGRHVSGKWLDPPVVFVEHNVNVEFHYWKDIIEHLAPARLKTSDGPVLKEAPEVIANKWITAKEQMNETFLRYIIEEKKYGVRRAEEALSSITGARSVMDKEKYEQVFELFSRTLITARLYEAAATSYFAYRIYARGEKFRTPWLEQTLNESLRNLIKISAEIDKYEGPVSRGQWNWRGDSETAREYYDKITNTGWKEYGNVVFKMN